MTIICPACYQVLGQVSASEATALSEVHASVCLATDEERWAAMDRLRFYELTKGLNL